MAHLGTPLYVKVDAVHARDVESPGAVIKCSDAEEVLGRLELLRTRYRKVLVQGHVAGVGVGAFLVRWNGTILARFMHKRIHEVPHTGGASSFRETWHHPGIMDDATRRLSGMQWNGAGMFEYRWDPSTDRYYLMEFNSRFWGSLHLALFAGVDFPRILADAFFGRPEQCNSRYAHVRSRLTFPKEVEYVRSRVKDPNLPFAMKAWSLVEFLLLGLDPRVRSDLNYPGDRSLYWRAIPRALRQFLA
jgi:predicted ATP-grasp superfamily ATP-dependent carboligase